MCRLDMWHLVIPTINNSEMPIVLEIRLVLIVTTYAKELGKKEILYMVYIRELNRILNIKYLLIYIIG